MTTATNKEQERPSTLTHTEGEVTPAISAIMRDLNEFEELLAVGPVSPELVRGARDRIKRKIDDVESFGGDGHSNPAWVVAALRANYHSTFGCDREAIVFEEQGLELAETDHQRAVSCNNLSHHLLVLDEPEQARDWAILAVRYEPENEGALINLAQSLYRNGERSEAAKILSRLAEVTGADPHNSVLGAYLRFEEAMIEMSDVLPSLWLTARDKGSTQLASLD